MPKSKKDPFFHHLPFVWQVEHQFRRVGKIESETFYFAFILPAYIHDILHDRVLYNIDVFVTVKTPVFFHAS